MRQNIEQLYAKRKQNQSIHKCEVSNEDYRRIAPKIEMIQRLAEIESSVYAVFDMNRWNYLLQSEEQKRIFGTGKSGGTDIDIKMHYNNIHPDDLAFVLETDNLLYDYFSKLSFNEKRDFKMIYDFRTRNTEGFYVRHLHQSIVLEQDRNGKTWLTLVISHLLSERNPNEKPQRRLINYKTGKLHLFNEIDGAGSGVVLTKREKEIMVLISRGYDSFNISEKLHISINTVNNHRQNILRKTKTDNTTQAVLYAKRVGLI